ncbi:MAG: DUF362 domain-containing protein [Anaerolineaceae bacterium]|nr:DUF362 domain-containing protein [Anaerolineaceae bacterium]
MRKLTRRELLLYFGAGLSAATLNQLLAACGVKPNSDLAPTGQPATLSPSYSITPIQSAPTSSLINGTTQAESALTPTPKAASTQGKNPDLVVAHGGQPEAMVRAALQALGGMQRFVPKGANVIIKPNICVAYHTYEYAATTNPWVVGALVKLCLEAGAASVKVMDSPFGGTPTEAYKVSGIQDQVNAAGGQMEFMRAIKYVSINIPKAVNLTSTDIYDDILKADVLINVPIAKTHDLARLTLGMKNLMGVIKDRARLHFDMGNCLTDLNSRVHSTLTVIDAVRILTRNGPTGGNLADVKQLDTIIASADIVAADSYGATLFGLKPEDLDYVKVATSRGLGRSDLKNLKIEDIPVGA